MILGIMQPYFVPYVEHFRLIAACDRWIVFDTVAYRRKTWMNRNRILDRNTGWSYLTVPVVRGATAGPVGCAGLASTDWRGTLRRRLRTYEHEAPFFAETTSLLFEELDRDHHTIADLDTGLLRGICRRLGIGTPIDRLSELGLDLPPAAGAGGWAPQIAEAVGASEYRNPSGGRHLFDPEAFARRGIALSFHQHAPLSYDTGGFAFVPDLSIIDPLMWCGIDVVAGWITEQMPTQRAPAT